MTAWDSIVNAALNGAPIKTSAPVAATDKFCPGCGEVKPRTEFYREGVS